MITLRARYLLIFVLKQPEAEAKDEYNFKFDQAPLSLSARKLKIVVRTTVYPTRISVVNILLVSREFLQVFPETGCRTFLMCFYFSSFCDVILCDECELHTSHS